MAPATAPGTDQLLSKAQDVVSAYIGCAPEDVQPSTDLIATHGLDSLDVLDLGLEIEKSFSVELPDVDSLHLRTVEDIVCAVQSAMNRTVAVGA